MGWEIILIKVRSLLIITTTLPMESVLRKLSSVSFSFWFFRRICDEDDDGDEGSAFFAIFNMSTVIKIINFSYTTNVGTKYRYG